MPCTLLTTQAVQVSEREKDPKPSITESQQWLCYSAQNPNPASRHAVYFHFPVTTAENLNQPRNLPTNLKPLRKLPYSNLPLTSLIPTTTATTAQHPTPRIPPNPHITTPASRIESILLLRRTPLFPIFSSWQWWVPGGRRCVLHLPCA